MSSVANDARAQKGNLKNNRTKPWAEDIHRIEKLLEVSSAVHKHFLVRDDLRNFDGEYKSLGSSSGPVVDRASRRTSVKRRVHLDRMKMFRVECEVVG